MAVLSAHQAVAQEFDPRAAPITNPLFLIKIQEKNNLKYAQETQKILNPDRFGTTFRNMHKYVHLYAQTSQYDPFGEETKDTLYRHAFNHLNAKDEADKAEAALDFRTKLEKHIGNFDVVTAAISILREQPSLYDMKTLQMIRGLMIERLMESGTGNGVRSAYRIYSASEEVFLLMMRGVERVHTQEITTEAMSYNIHMVRNVKTDHEEIIYTDITAMLQKAVREQALQRALVHHQMPDYDFDAPPEERWQR